LVFTDIRMPEISGLDLIRMTKEKKIDADFVIVSGFAEFEYAQEALRRGALDYCLKPIDIGMTDQLLERMALHFHKKRSIRNNLFLEALTSNDKSELKRLTHFFDDSSKDYFRVLLFYFNREQKNYPDISFFDSQNAENVEFGERKILYIIKSKNREDLEEIENSAFFTMPNIKTVGISSISADYDNIAKLIKEADIAASKTFVMEKQLDMNNLIRKVVFIWLPQASRVFGRPMAAPTFV